MADNKDNKPEDKGSKPALTTSSSLDKPLLDEKPVEEAAGIDTSHLSLDDNTAQAGGSLEKERKESTPSIKTSHLSLKDEGKTPARNKPENNVEETQPPVNEQETTDQSFSETKSEPDDGSLIINNPYVEKANTEATAGKPDSSSEIAPKDEQVMLTSGVSDTEFEKEAHSEEEDNTIDEIISENDFNPEETGAIKQLLDTVKKPENLVRDAWSNSSARRYLIDNVDSYREKDEDQNMEEAIEKMYGGAAKGRFAPGKFLKENVLFSILISIFLFLVGWKAAIIFFPDIMPAINDQIIETVQIQAPKKRKPVEKEVIVTNQANKEIIDNTLSHCLIEPDARTEFNIAFNKVGYEYSNQPLTFSYEETRDAIKVWESMDIDFYIKDGLLRFKELAGLALPVIVNAREAISDYSRSLIRISEEAKELDARIRNIKTRGGNQSTNTVNERLPLRNKLDKLNSRLAEEPNQERFIQLLAKLGLIEHILLGNEEPNRVKPDQVTKNDPEWLIATADTKASDITAPISDNVLPAIQIPAEKLKEQLPKLTAFHLSELDSALDDLLKLSSLIIFLPENKLISYNLELTGLNRRINKLMKTKLPAWVSTNQCLTTMRSTALAAP